MERYKSLETLRSAVRIEQQEELGRTQRCAEFMKTMEAFRKNEGPAPSAEAFKQWCEDVQRRRALHRLKSDARDSAWQAPRQAPCATASNASSPSSLSRSASNGALGTPISESTVINR
jgi:hypothetical protein